MNIVRKILDRFNMLCAVFGDGNKYSLVLAECVYTGKDVKIIAEKEVGQTAETSKELKSRPLILILSGYGVISKDISAAADLADKIKAAGSGFVWSEDKGGHIAFMRETQAKTLLDELADSHAGILHTVCVPEMERKLIINAAKELSKDFYDTGIMLRTILKPTRTGSAAALYIAKKLMLPALGIMLLLLAVNAVVAPGISSRYQSTLARLEQVRADMSRASDLSQQNHRVLEEFGGKLPREYAWLCDRAGLTLPAGVTLTSLSIQPLLKNIEENKKLQLSANRMVISGRSADSGDISEYVKGLENLRFASDILFSSVEQDRDGAMLAFRIEIKL